jgi:hypothetical protein
MYRIVASTCPICSGMTLMLRGAAFGAVGRTVVLGTVVAGTVVGAGAVTAGVVVVVVGVVVVGGTVVVGVVVVVVVSGAMVVVGVVAGEAKTAEPDATSAPSPMTVATMRR